MKHGLDVSGRAELTIMIMFLFGTAQGQECPPDSLVLYSGYVLLAKDSTAVSNAHILNLTRGTGTVSSIDGSFELQVRNLDTLRFSCVGLEEFFYYINTCVQLPELLIYLKQDTVMMDEILISPLPPRRFFKYVFLSTKLPKPEEPELNLAPMFKNDPAYVPPTGIRFTGPVQAVYNAFNKKARLERKLKNNRKKYSKFLVPVTEDRLIYPDTR